jgi:hypothetical protein
MHSLDLVSILCSILLLVNGVFLVNAPLDA